MDGDVELYRELEQSMVCVDEVRTGYCAIVDVDHLGCYERVQVCTLASACGLPCPLGWVWV